MAGELNEDLFFGVRIINFVDSVIRGSLKLSPISDFEKQIIQHKEEIRELNQQVDNNLVTLMRNAQDFITPTLALKLILYFHKIDRTRDGEKILYFAARDETVLGEDDIRELTRELRKDPDMNIDLWIAVLGRDPEPESPVSPRQGLNLPSDFR